MQIVIEGTDLPGRAVGIGRNVNIGVQRRGKAEWLDLQPADADSVRWAVTASASLRDDGVLDALGPQIQGGPGERFIYLSWVDLGGDGEFTLIGRTKLWLNAVPATVAAAAIKADRLVGRLPLSNEKGGPVLASVRPPKITWSTR
ncbi:MAG TPA: DUF5990 family protein [Micromonosporaceae bacterium]|jgi:hypothetical protein